MPHPRHRADARAPLPIGFLGVPRRHLVVVAAALSLLSMVNNALPASAETARPGAATAELQSLTIAADVVRPPVVRDAFVITHFSTVRWPLAADTEISSNFGFRAAPCATCSSDHRGVDWTPGEGTPIAAIANGVVTEVGNPSGELGVYAIVDHVIDGETVSSVYGHMRGGSLDVAVGDRVTTGQTVGLVGNTGESTGAHLHFGILRGDGTPIDPVAWLRAHVTE